MNPNLPQALAQREPSHVYHVSASHWVKLMAGVLAIALLLMMGLGLLQRVGALPGNAHLRDPDSTIIATKASMASEPTEKSVAFVGDSSCLINIDIPTLQQSGIEAVNLGTLSYLGIDAFGLLARRFCEGKAKPRIILVLHPECLRMVEPSEDHRKILESALGGATGADGGWHWKDIRGVTFDAFRERLLDRWIPTPLKGRMGMRYGFTGDLRSELRSRGGTMEETASFDPSQPQGSAEYRLARRIRAECEAFRAALPKNAELQLLISPIPKSHALRGHDAKVKEMQAQVEEWLKADLPSLSLPSQWPDAEFGTVTHLLPSGAVNYSRILAQKLSVTR